MYFSGALVFQFYATELPYISEGIITLFTSLHLSDSHVCKLTFILRTLNTY